MRSTLIAFALVAGLVCAEAAGIKGRPQQQQAAESLQRVQSVKGPLSRTPIQQQSYLPPPPAAAQQQQAAAQAAQGLKGPGQAAPVFTAARVQPIEQQPQQQQQQEPEPEQVQQQQQQVEQQQQEIDPNAAAQDSAPAVLAPARPAAPSEEEANPRPEPYSFQYAFNSGDSATSGSSTREEQQDASGRVTGFYTLKGEDGRDRRVDYVADASGFRATISTNELGTAPKDSADVDWNAQNPSDAQLRAAESATQAARARALASPQQHHSFQPQQQQQQQALASASSPAFGKLSGPRQKGPGAIGTNQLQASKANLANQGNQQQQQLGQLQEPFEQIRQTELNTRARRQSRHAPFYLFTV